MNLLMPLSESFFWRFFASRKMYPDLFRFFESFLPFGRPGILPWAFERLSPSIVRSRINDLSKSAKAERIWKCSFPVAVEKSKLSVIEINPIPLSNNSVTSKMSSVLDLAQRSSL